jgi:hypothetical protein
MEQQKLFKRSHVLAEDDNDPYMGVGFDASKPLARFEKDKFLKTPIADSLQTIKLVGEVDKLQAELAKLKNKGVKKRPLKPADRIYNRIKKEYETEHFGKIIAIDVHLKRVVGIGDTLDDAYEQAVEETGREQFDFKRVGYSYLYKL